MAQHQRNKMRFGKDKRFACG